MSDPMTDRAPRPEGMTYLADLLESRATAIHEWLTNDESSGIIEILHDDDHTPPAIAYELMREAAETIRRLRADGATLRERVKTLPSPVTPIGAYLQDRRCEWCDARWPNKLTHPDNGCLWPEVHKDAK